MKTLLGFLAALSAANVWATPLPGDCPIPGEANIAQVEADLNRQLALLRDEPLWSHASSPAKGYFGSPETFVETKLSTDGRKVAVFTSRGKVQVFETATGKLTSVLFDLAGGPKPTNAAFSDDLKYVALTFDGKPPRLKIFDLTSGEAVSTFNRTFTEAKFSEGNAMLCVTNKDRSVEVISLKSGDVIWKGPPGAKSPIYRFPPPPQLPSSIVVASGKEVEIVSLVNPGRSYQSKIVHNANITALEYSKDGRYLLSADEGGTCKVLELSSGREIRQINHNPKGLMGAHDILSATFSPDGTLVATCIREGHCMVTEISTGRIVYQRTAAPRDLNSYPKVGFSSDGGQLVLVERSGKAEIVDLHTGQDMQIIDNIGSVSKAQFVGDSNQVLTVSRNQIQVTPIKGMESPQGGSPYRDMPGGPKLQLQPVNASTWKAPLQTSAKRDLQLSPSGRYSVVTSNEKNLVLVDNLTGRSQTIEATHGFTDYRISDHNLVYAEDNLSGTVKVVRLEDGLVSEYAGQKTTTRHTISALSPDGKFAIIDYGESFGTELVDLENLSVVRKMSSKKTTFSPDGRWTVFEAEDGGMHLVSNADGKVVWSSPGKLASAAFDRNELQIRNENGVVRVIMLGPKYPREIGSFSVAETPNGHLWGTGKVVYSDDKKFVLVEQQSPGGPQHSKHIVMENSLSHRAEISETYPSIARQKPALKDIDPNSTFYVQSPQNNRFPSIVEIPPNPSGNIKIHVAERGFYDPKKHRTIYEGDWRYVTHDIPAEKGWFKSFRWKEFLGFSKNEPGMFAMLTDKNEIKWLSMDKVLSTFKVPDGVKKIADFKLKEGSVAAVLSGDGKLTLQDIRSGKTIEFPVGASDVQDFQLSPDGKSIILVKVGEVVKVPLP